MRRDPLLVSIRVLLLLQDTILWCLKPTFLSTLTILQQCYCNITVHRSFCNVHHTHFPHPTSGVVCDNWFDEHTANTANIINITNITNSLTVADRKVNRNREKRHRHHWHKTDIKCWQKYVWQSIECDTGSSSYGAKQGKERRTWCRHFPIVHYSLLTIHCSLFTVRTIQCLHRESNIMKGQRSCNPFDRLYRHEYITLPIAHTNTCQSHTNTHIYIYRFIYIYVVLYVYISVFMLCCTYT